MSYYPIDTLNRKPWYHRLAARIVATHILKGSDSYQMSGSVNWLLDWQTGEAPLYDGGADIQAPKYQLAHWVLQGAGYSVCVADLMDDDPKSIALNAVIIAFAEAHLGGQEREADHLIEQIALKGG